MKRKIIFSLIISLITVLVILKLPAQSATQIPVTSYRLEDTREFNQQLISELSGGDVSIWQVSPLPLALRYLNGANGGNFTQITRKFPPSSGKEFSDTEIITTIQTGYLDDSVAGEWVELTFKQNPQGIWLIEEAKRAFLCQRNRNTDRFQQDFCD